MRPHCRSSRRLLASLCQGQEASFPPSKKDHSSHRLPPKKGRKGNQKKGPDGVGLFSPRKGCCFPEGQRGPSKAATAFPPANVGPVGRGPRDGSGLGFARKAKNEGQRRRRGMIASCDSEIVQRFGLFAVFVKLATDEKLRG